MSIRSSFVVLLAATCATLAAQGLNPRSTMHITFPDDSPVAVVSANWGESRATPRGGAMLLDLHTSLTLRNSSSRVIRGVTLQVLAQDVTPGGKGSVSLASLNVAPGEVFPVRVDLQLLRPLQTGSGPVVEIGLDGVLFEDLTFYGPDKLHSRRLLTNWETEARRDRRHFVAILEKEGMDGLRRELVECIARESARPRVDVQVARGRATNVDPEQYVQFAFVQIPDSPIEPTGGMAQVAGAEARAPRIEVRNRSNRHVRYAEIGWIVRDRNGSEFYAASVPSQLNLAPGQSREVAEQTVLRFSRPQGGRVEIEALKGFVNQVEFSDGRVWIPSREALKDTRLSSVLAPSPEEQRLTGLYRKKGLEAVAQELQRLQ